MSIAQKFADYLEAQQMLSTGHARLLELWRNMAEDSRAMLIAPAELLAQLLEKGGWREAGTPINSAGGVAPDPVGASDPTWPQKFPGEDV